MKVLRNLLASKDNDPDVVTVSRSDAAFMRIATYIASRIPHTKDLASRLEMLATAAARLPGIQGALVAACSEDGLPLAHKAEALSLSNGNEPFAVLRALMVEAAKEDDWVEMTTEQLDLFEISEGSALRARRAYDESGSVGLIIVNVREGRGTEFVEDFEKTLPCITWAIRDSVELSQRQRVNDLRQAELEELGLAGPIRTASVASRLKKIFCAEAVTILWREQGRLYLSATTDGKIAQENVSYDPGVGFTGHVLKTGAPILLYDATDREEIRAELGRKLEKSRVAAQYPEALAESGEPFRFLAVPMRKAVPLSLPDQAKNAGQARATQGVIRFLRRISDPPFTAVERNDAQHFADLLGLAMLASWRWILTEHILKAETEAICITRNDFKKDSGDCAVPRMVFTDPGAECLFGMSSDNLYGKDARALYADGEYEKIRKVLKGTLAKNEAEHGPIRTKVRRESREGVEIRSVEASYRLLMSPFVEPAAPYAIAVIRDTTERQHLVELLANKKLAYFRSDKDGNTVETSDAEAELTGYSTEDLEGKQRKDLYLVRSDRAELMERVREANGKFVYARERLKRKDDSWFWAEGFVRLLRDQTGEEKGTDGLYEDVTDRLELQGFLDVEPGVLLKGHELYSKLEKNARFQLLFMTSLSHQLRSPLGALIRHLENFSKGVTDASRFSKHLKYCIGQAKTCGQLVTNLTYMDKILKRESFRFKKIDLTRLAIETKLDYRDLAERHGVRIRVHDAELNRMFDGVWGHSGLLRQVFINLFDNAIKYSLPRTTVVVRGVEEVGAKCLRISNEGFRIPRKDRERIFDQGVRLPKAKAWASDGSGLGLWLIRKILDSHGAKICCTEVYEYGEDRTAFKISFPVGPLRRSVDRRRLH